MYDRFYTLIYLNNFRILNENILCIPYLIKDWQKYWIGLTEILERVSQKFYCWLFLKIHCHIILPQTIFKFQLAGINFFVYRERKKFDAEIQFSKNLKILKIEMDLPTSGNCRSYWEESFLEVLTSNDLQSPDVRKK